jgi:hypothetical protein
MSLSPMAAVAVDIAGRHMAGTASGSLMRMATSMPTCNPLSLAC